MSDEIVIRPAREDDGEFIAALVLSLLEFGSPAWKDKQALAPGYAGALTRAVRGQGLRSSVLIAESTDGMALGFVSLKVTQDLTGVERCHVADLAVTEAARRMGIGSELMNAAEQWARDRGLAVLSLDVWSTNERAQAFYRRLGYRVESSCLIKELG